jgi:serine/threonine protein kinase/ABC-type branched-subunit amino acid transport system substrate-binding protein
MTTAEKDLAAAAEDDTERHSIYSAQPFGKYILVQKLAEGGMAEIFLAKQTGDGTGIAGFERNVVIKRMLAHLSRQPEFVDMFLDEARLASRLNHPNIIPIYDLGLAEGSYYICMEYLPGEDLSWVLRQARGHHRQLPIDVAVRIVIDAARGLHHAHEFADEDGKPLNIVHRDVSPGNIYIGYEGQVKVLDFGIAKAESRVTSTTVGIVKGKAMYMSPEQSRAEPVDRRSDIYALGVTLYETLTISRPFMRDSAQGMMHAVLRGDFEPPRKRRPELPEELEQIVLKAMALDANDRFATAAEMADALERLLDATTASGGASVGRFLRDLCGEHQMSQKTRIPTLSSLQAMKLSSQAHMRTVEDARTPSQLQPLPPETKKPRLRPLIGAALVLAVGAAAIVGYRMHGAAVPEGCEARYGSDAGDAIVLGATLPLTVDGKRDESGQEQLNALRLALDEINQRDGVAGRRFAVRVCDNAGETIRAKSEIAWLVEHEKVPAIFLAWSSHAIAAINYTLPRGVLVMSAEATSPELAAVPASADGVRLLWRTAPSDAVDGQILAQLLAHDPMFAGIKRVGVLYQDDPYGQGLAGIILQTLPKTAPELELHAIQYPFRGDVTSAVAQLAATRPDVTVLLGFANDGTRILNLAAKSPSLQRVHGHRWLFADAIKEPSLFNGLDHPEELDGMFGVESADGGGAEALSFGARFHARFLRDAQEQTYSANRYDAMYLVALGAAWAAGKDGHGAITGIGIAEGLAHLSSGAKFSLTPEHFTAAKAFLQSGRSIDVEGASGRLDFDNVTGEAASSFRLWRITGKSFVHDRRIAWPPLPSP